MSFRPLLLAAGALLVLATAAQLPVAADYEQRAIYITQGRIQIDDMGFDAGQLVVLRPRQPVTVRANGNARVLLLGGEPLDGPRHLWWNFVSSSIERIEQAKEDWREGRLGSVAGDPEYIPLPATPAVRKQSVDYP